MKTALPLLKEQLTDDTPLTSFVLLNSSHSEFCWTVWYDHLDTNVPLPRLRALIAYNMITLVLNTLPYPLLTPHSPCGYSLYLQYAIILHVFLFTKFFAMVTRIVTTTH